MTFLLKCIGYMAALIGVAGSVLLFILALAGAFTVHWTLLFAVLLIAPLYVACECVMDWAAENS